MNVSVNASAQPGTVTVTASSGLNLVTLTSTVEILPYSSRTATLKAPVTNLATGLPGVPAGGAAVIGTSGLPSNLSDWVLTIGEIPTTFTTNSLNQLIAQVPVGVSIGPAIVRLTSPGRDALQPILMQVDPPPPSITAILNAAGIAVDSAHAAQIGDQITAIVAGLADPTVALQANQVQVKIAGVVQTVQSIAPTGTGSLAVKFAIAAGTPAGPQQPLTVGVDTRISDPRQIAIRSSDTSDTSQ